MSSNFLTGVKFSTLAATLVATVLLSPAARGAGKSDEGINAHAYQILCDIYNVASSPPKTLYETNEVNDLREKIDVINASLADDHWVEEIGKAGTANQLSESFKKQYGSDEAQFGKWKKAVEKLLEPESKIHKLRSEEHLVKVARRKVAQVEDQFEKIVQRMATLAKTTDLTAIEDGFAAVINDKSCEATGNTLCGTKANRITKCGGDTKTSDGEGGLVLDFFCLCAKQSSGSSCGNDQYACGKECGVDVSGQGWNSGSGVASAHQIWEELKKGCQARRLVPERSLELAGRKAISNFLRELGRVKGAFVANQKPCGVGVLGSFFQHTGACGSQKVNCKGDLDGTSNTDGVCVNYGTETAKWGQIQWVTRFNNALDKLKDAETVNITIQTEFTQLKRLQTRANEIYEETVALLELEKDAPERNSQTQTQTQHQNPGNPSEKATAQEPVIVGSGSLPTFFLPWALLI